MKTNNLLLLPWTPFVTCEAHSHDPTGRIYKNSRYQVYLYRYSLNEKGKDLIHLSFKRLDQGIIIPFRDKRQIVSDLVSPLHEALELYPARSREIDVCNQYHLYLIDDSSEQWPYTYEDFSFSKWIKEDERTVLDHPLSQPWTPFEKYQSERHNSPIQVYRDSRYVVACIVEKDDEWQDGLIHLCIERLDGGIIIPYREMMKIKDALVGAEYEAIEVLPPLSRGVGYSSQHHLFLIDNEHSRMPFGYTERLVSDACVGNAKQESWPADERPPDCLSEEEVREKLRQQGLLAYVEAKD